jgi:hypothetical protein
MKIYHFSSTQKFKEIFTRKKQWRPPSTTTAGKEEKTKGYLQAKVGKVSIMV